ncbi:dicarboxylate/amino acid:cation symporter [Lagierella sp.]|uniref:dicarboxylate/amino acid:cation symporter n=1 Tax=Lagierella sp. TaxID=2849657 RepID=UPI0026072E04|nr:dicarboxylate/amino acid:cation symporter [Lagierella sp.]
MTNKNGFQLGLLPKLIIGVICGILIGSFAPLTIMRGINTIVQIFSNYLNFIVPMIILAFVVTGISDLGAGSGKILGFSVFMSYGSTILWGFVAYFLSMALFPQILDLSGTASVNEMGEIEPFFTIEMPPLANITSILILAFVLGIGISLLRTEKIKGLFSEFHRIINMVLEKSIIPFLPLYIAGIFAQLTFSGNIQEILKSYGAVFIAVVVFQIIVNILEYIIAKTYNRDAPTIAQFIKNQIPSWLTAIGTQSSAATIPITLQTAEKNGTSKEIRDFFIPLSATIHFPGSSIAIMMFATAVMLMDKMTPSFGSIVIFILLMGVTMVAAPGVPGGAIMAALGLLGAHLGFNDTQSTLMIALYLAQDSFGTACSVAGNCALVTIIDKKAKQY